MNTPRFADLATLDDGPAAPAPRVLLHSRRRVLAHPLRGLWPPWSAEWASGHTDGSPMSPWHGQATTTRVAVAMVADPGRRAAEIAEVHEKRRMMAAMEIAFGHPDGPAAGRRN